MELVMEHSEVLGTESICTVRKGVVGLEIVWIDDIPHFTGKEIRTGAIPDIDLLASVEECIHVYNRSTKPSVKLNVVKRTNPETQESETACIMDTEKATYGIGTYRKLAASLDKGIRHMMDEIAKDRLIPVYQERVASGFFEVNKTIFDVTI